MHRKSADYALLQFRILEIITKYSSPVGINKCGILTELAKTIKINEWKSEIRYLLADLEFIGIIKQTNDAFKMVPKKERNQNVRKYAATRIQAAFKGFQTRKELEHNRRQNLANAKHYRQDDYTISSVTSIVDDASVSSLATNADPSGLTSLSYIDSSQKHNIVRDLKSVSSFSEGISYVTQLQTETSPTAILLGGINPRQAKDYVLGRRVLGGISNASGSEEVLDENDYYNRETGKYMEGASLPHPLTGSAAVALPIDYIATSDPKWVYSSSGAVNKTRKSYDFADLNSTGYYKKFKVIKKVHFADWPDRQASNSEVNLRFGTLPKEFAVTSNNSQTTKDSYYLLPPHADPNLSMMGYLCDVYRRAKNNPDLGNMKSRNIKSPNSCPILLVMGGLQTNEPNNISYGKVIIQYHTLKNRWEYFGALPQPRNYHAAVYYQENIYVSGGCDPDKRNSGEMVATSNTYCLNIHSNEWIEKAEMHCCRSHHNMVVALGKIIVIGGRDDNGRLVASIEAYDIESDKWSILRPMTHPRMGMACSVVDDHIWCMGGIGMSEDPYDLSYPVLSSVVSYDIGKDVWMKRPPLRCPRAFGSCVFLDGSMWLLGGASKEYGYDVMVSMASVDKYYPVDGQWNHRTVLSNPRHSSAVVAVDTCIYILGGISSQEWSPLSRNEMLVVDDISLHTCEPLPVPLTGLAAVAVPPVLPSI